MGRMLVTIHDPRCINRIDPTSRCDDLLIRFKIAGVAVEILTRGKLCWIDINADNDPLGGFFGGGHKCQMPVMDGPHCWHQTYCVTGRAPVANGAAHIIWSGKNHHR